MTAHQRGACVVAALHARHRREQGDRRHQCRPPGRPPARIHDRTGGVDDASRRGLTFASLIINMLQQRRSAKARRKRHDRPGHRLRHRALDLHRGADRGRPRHADGRAPAALLAPGRPRRRRHRDAAQGARAGRGPDPLPRRRGPGRACSTRAARIAAPRCTTARSRSAASAAAITAGCSTCRAIASSSLASRRAARGATRCASPGIRCEERYGLVFAYLGPPEKKPVLPRYECLEVLEPGEFVEADDSSIGSGGALIVPCNWLQHFENVVGHFHVPILHGCFSGPQFIAQMGLMPKVTLGLHGARREGCSRCARWKTARVHPARRRRPCCPTLRVVPNPRVAQLRRVESIGWVLPIDDTHYRIYVAGRVRETGELARAPLGDERQVLARADARKSTSNSRATTRRRPARARSPSIPTSTLGTTDKGIVMLRRLLHRQVDAVHAAKIRSASTSIRPRPPLSSRPATSSSKPDRQPCSGNQAGRIDAGDAHRLVFLAGAAARAGRAQHVAVGVLDHDGAGLRQELALGGRRKRAEELRVLLGALQRACGSPRPCRPRPRPCRRRRRSGTCWRRPRAAATSRGPTRRARRRRAA